MGDIKFGELKGTDRFGNKYFEVRTLRMNRIVEMWWTNVANRPL